MTVTIYHNPACGTSRNTLAMIRQSGGEPEVIEYLKTPPSRARLVELVKAMGVPVRELLREKGTPYAELGLADPKWSDDQLIDFMLAHPILINRPIVVTPKGVRLCRPSELVLDLPREPVIAEIDPRRIERVLRNLLANAIDHGEHRPVVGVPERVTLLGIGGAGPGIEPALQLADRDDLPTELGDRIAHDRLGAPARVRLRVVEEVHARLAGHGEALLGQAGVDLVPEGDPGAEGQGADLQARAAETVVGHGAHGGPPGAVGAGTLRAPPTGAAGR